MSMIHEITSLSPRNKKSQRKGRGESSGRGKTSGRGNKGSKARVGTYIKPGYEGGQTPIFRRFPKRGFSNYKFETNYQVVNLLDLNRFENGATVDAVALKEAGLISGLKTRVKILGEGKLTKKLTIVAGWYSKSAHKQITDAGGTAQNLKGEAFAFPKEKKKFIPREGAPAGGKKKKIADEGAEPAPDATAGGEKKEAAAAPAADAPKSE